MSWKVYRGAVIAKIRDKYPGRRDGGYTRLFDDANLGSLMSSVQSAINRTGNELEHIIKRESVANESAITDLAKFLANGGDGVFLADKSVVKKFINASEQIQFQSTEPDYLVFVRDGSKRECYVLELKDGDQFDTKKASGEVEALKTFSTHVGSTLPYSTTIRVCSFNQDNRQAIVTGFKKTVDESEVWTGREFCELLGFDYDAIVNGRKADAEDNKRFFVEQLLLIPDLRQIIEQQLGIRFIQPDTAVAERIDQLFLIGPHEEQLHQRRLDQAQWLKRVMTLHWSDDLPQPFIGFDLDEGLFIMEWQSDTECNTLTIDAERRKAWYDPWPASQDDPASAIELDLDTEEGWECLRSAIMTTQP